MSYSNNENYELCHKCGGRCCKNSGCEYFTEDIKEFTLSYLESMLATGRVTLTSNFSFSKTKNGSLTIDYILTLRARNVNRPEIELITDFHPCINLEENGCYYDFANRPSGGKHLIPGEIYCISDYDRDEELQKWLPYQKILTKLLKRRTGLSIMAKYQEETFIIFERFLNNDADLSNLLLEAIPYLKECFPFLWNKALTKSKSDNILLVRKK